MTAWFQAEKAKVLLVHFRIIANDLATPNLSLLLDVFPLQQCSLSPPTFNALQLVSEDSWDFISHTLQSRLFVNLTNTDIILVPLDTAREVITAVYSEEAYEKVLDILCGAVADYVEQNPDLRNQPTEDMWDFKDEEEDQDDSWDEEEDDWGEEEDYEDEEDY